MKKNYKEIKKMVMDNYEEIRETILAAMKDMEGYSGFKSDVELDLETGKAHYTSALTSNSQSMESWKGETLVIARVKGWEVGAEGFDYDFDETVKLEDNYEELQAEYEKEEEEGNFFDIQSFVEEKYPEIIEKMDADMREYLIDDYFPDLATRKLEEFIMDLDHYEGD